MPAADANSEAPNPGSTEHKAGAPDPAPAPAPQASGPARPDWAPEAFWDAEKGALKAEDLARAHVELGARFAKGKAGFADEVRLEVRQEIEKEARKNAPEKPDGYQVAVPKEGLPGDLVVLDKAPAEDFQFEGGKRYFVLDPKHPLLGFWREVSHKAGFSQADFDRGVMAFAEANAMRVPTAEEVAAQKKAFYDSLGEKGVERASMLWGGLKTVLGEEQAKALDAAITGPAQVAALEALVQKAGGPKFAAAPAAGAADQLTPEKLRAWQDDPKYWRDRDPAWVRKVEDGYARLYPGKRTAA